MKIIKTVSRFYFMVFPVFLISACANPYRANFNSTMDRFPTWMGNRLAPKAERPELFTSDNIRADNWKLFEKGYIMIGFSKFDGPNVDTRLALKEGRAAGADIVLVQKKFSKTLTETVTVTQWAPDEVTEVREETDIAGGSRGRRQVSRRTEIRTSRDPETVYVPKQVDYYEHSATFWRKVRSPLFGAFVEDLTDELKQKHETNRGLVVRAVMIDSPAYEADLLKGDVILKMNGEPVPSAQRFYEDLASRAGKKVDLLIARGEKTVKRRLSLNS